MWVVLGRGKSYVEGLGEWNQWGGRCQAAGRGAKWHSFDIIRFCEVDGGVGFCGGRHVEDTWRGVGGAGWRGGNYVGVDKFGANGSEVLRKKGSVAVALLLLSCVQ